MNRLLNTDCLDFLINDSRSFILKIVHDSIECTAIWKQVVMLKNYELFSLNIPSGGHRLLLLSRSTFCSMVSPWTNYSNFILISQSSTECGFLPTAKLWRQKLLNWFDFFYPTCPLLMAFSKKSSKRPVKAKSSAFSSSFPPTTHSHSSGE